MSDLVQGMKREINRQAWIDQAAVPLQEAVKKIYASGGQLGQKVMDFMHGAWLGHPLHPVLTDVPIGAWTVAVVLDAVEASSGSHGMRKAADTAVGLGIAGAVGAAVTGVTEFMHLNGESRRTGFLHAALNTMALGFFIASLAARKDRNRGLGRNLALTGYSVAALSAYLGGDLVFRQKIGVNHAPKDIKAEDFTAVMPVDRLTENQLTRASVNGTEIVLLRRSGQVFVLAQSCAHLGGPLSEGQLSTAKDGHPAVTCPWHGSTFNMATGDVISSPSAYPQPCFEARIFNGQVEVRHREESR
jgi:nitrite reductase/ring-hydroxylating ferredoxin subunit/uncharacterized membrane protein